MSPMTSPFVGSPFECRSARGREAHANEGMVLSNAHCTHKKTSKRVHASKGTLIEHDIRQIVMSRL